MIVEYTVADIAAHLKQYRTAILLRKTPLVSLLRENGIEYVSVAAFGDDNPNRTWWILMEKIKAGRCVIVDDGSKPLWHSLRARCASVTLVEEHYHGLALRLAEFTKNEKT